MERGQQLAAEPPCACEQGAAYCARCYARVEREVAQAKLEHWLATYGTQPRPAQLPRPLRLVWSKA